MTRREAAIVSAYTGYLLGSFGELHQYIEELLGRPVLTHELRSGDLLTEIQEKAKPDFIGISIEG